jgi:biopolymer transport protein ExbB/TolQ
LDSFAASLPAKSSSLVVDYLRQIIANKGNQARVDLLLSSYEIEADKSLSVSKTLTKMGPILGLMGTLIPMGPALVGLSTGDIASMAYNMQVAFATTVVGLVISAIGFVTQQTKERWYVRDLAMLDYVAELQKQSVA